MTISFVTDDDRHAFEIIDAHAGGNPTRLIVGGLPQLHGTSMAEVCADFAQRFDWLRTCMVLEPRGGNLTSAVVIVPPTDPRADIGLFFMEAHGFLEMCGSDTISTVTSLLETGRLRSDGDHATVHLDTPAGLIEATADLSAGRVTSVTFTNAPAYVTALDVEVGLGDLGKTEVDVAYGGNHYAIIDADRLGLDIVGVNNRRAIDTAMLALDSVNAELQRRLESPPVVDHVLFHASAGIHDDADRLMVVIPPGIIDRSPCGTGTTARVATLVERGAMSVGDQLAHRSITHETFSGQVVSIDLDGSRPRTTVAITGSAYITGSGQIHVDGRDPLHAGFHLT